LVARPIAALYKHIRKQTRDNFAWGRLIENHHSINAFQRCKNFRSLAFRQDRASGAFQLADARITVEADDQRVTETARLLEAADVPGMQQIETAVGEDNSAAVAFLAPKPQNRFVESQNLRMQRNSMKAHAKIASALKERLVYHAQEAQRFRGWRPS
jgi:hypothetical protein